MAGWHLAQVNVGWLVAAMADPRVAPCFDALDRINALADISPAFVWRTFYVGDGPAVFLTLIIGTLVVTGAITLQLGVNPPFWTHIVVWPSLSFALVIWGLRVAKAALFQSEYCNKAREGRRL